MSLQLFNSKTAPSTLAGSLSSRPTARSLHPDEVALLGRMLEAHPDLQAKLSAVRVVEMEDGGMGSLRFLSEQPGKLGAVVAEAHAADADNVSLEISVNVDQRGELFELDIWKVDFSPLQRLPQPQDLVFSR